MFWPKIRFRFTFRHSTPFPINHQNRNGGRQTPRRLHSFEWTTDCTPSVILQQVHTGSDSMAQRSSTPTDIVQAETEALRRLGLLKSFVSCPTNLWLISPDVSFYPMSHWWATSLQRDDTLPPPPRIKRERKKQMKERKKTERKVWEECYYFCFIIEDINHSIIFFTVSAPLKNTCLDLKNDFEKYIFRHFQHSNKIKKIQKNFMSAQHKSAST